MALLLRERARPARVRTRGRWGEACRRLLVGGWALASVAAVGGWSPNAAALRAAAGEGGLDANPSPQRGLKRRKGEAARRAKRLPANQPEKPAGNAATRARRPRPAADPPAAAPAAAARAAAAFAAAAFAAAAGVEVAPVVSAPPPATATRERRKQVATRENLGDLCPLEIERWQPLPLLVYGETRVPLSRRNLRIARCGGKSPPGRLCEAALLSGELWLLASLFCPKEEAALERWWHCVAKPTIAYLMQNTCHGNARCDQLLAAVRVAWLRKMRCISSQMSDSWDREARKMVKASGAADGNDSAWGGAGPSCEAVDGSGLPTPIARCRLCVLREQLLSQGGDWRPLSDPDREEFSTATNSSLCVGAQSEKACAVSTCAVSACAVSACAVSASSTESGPLDLSAQGHDVSGGTEKAGDIVVGKIPLKESPGIVRVPDLTAVAAWETDTASRSCSVCRGPVSLTPSESSEKDLQLLGDALNDRIVRDLRRRERPGVLFLLMFLELPATPPETAEQLWARAVLLAAIGEGVSKDSFRRRTPALICQGGASDVRVLQYFVSALRFLLGASCNEAPLTPQNEDRRVITFRRSTPFSVVAAAWLVADDLLRQRRETYAPRGAWIVRPELWGRVWRRVVDVLLDAPSGASERESLACVADAVIEGADLPRQFPGDTLYFPGAPAVSLPSEFPKLFRPSLSWVHSKWFENTFHVAWQVGLLAGLSSEEAPCRFENAPSHVQFLKPFGHLDSDPLTATALGQRLDGKEFSERGLITPTPQGWTVPAHASQEATALLQSLT